MALIPEVSWAMVEKTCADLVDKLRYAAATDPQSSGVQFELRHLMQRFGKVERELQICELEHTVRTAEKDAKAAAGGKSVAAGKLKELRDGGG